MLARLYLHLVGRHILYLPSVEAIHLLGSQAHTRPQTVHGNIPATDDSDPFSDQIRISQTLLSKKHSGRDDSFHLVFIRYPGRGMIHGANSHQDRIKAATHKGLKIKINPKLHPGLYFNTAESKNAINILIKVLFGKAVLGNTIVDHASQLWQPFKDLHLVPKPSQIKGRTQPAGATPHNGHPVSRVRCHRDLKRRTLIHHPV